ncbi:MAG TPA: hypothetical protein VM123_00020 [archaeon]|nr:hypothetical protein [archaeon]
MYLTILFLVILILALVALAVAMAYYRRQRMLDEKKVHYLGLRKENGNHWRRFESYQADIDRIRSDYNARLREIAILLGEIEQKRKEVRDVLGILKEEVRQKDDSMDRDLGKIIDRRKDIYRKLWSEFNGKKALYLSKLRQAKQSQVAIQNTNVKKDQEYQRWNETKILMERVKKEYESLLRNPLFSFMKKP